MRTNLCVLLSFAVRDVREFAAGEGLLVFARTAEQLSRRRQDIPMLVVDGRGQAGALTNAGGDLSSAANLHMMENTPDPRDYYRVTKLLASRLPHAWSRWETSPDSRRGLPLCLAAPCCIAAPHPGSTPRSPEATLQERGLASTGRILCGHPVHQTSFLGGKSRSCDSRHLSVRLLVAPSIILVSESELPGLGARELACSCRGSIGGASPRIASARLRLGCTAGGQDTAGPLMRGRKEP
jgi:hypothetical protein